MLLPDKFKDMMTDMLGDDSRRFFSCCDEKPYRGIRVNTLKVTADDLLPMLDFKVRPSPFCKEGYYVEDEVTGIGNSPLHHAGAFYVQEPSASSAVEAMGIEEGDFVLDLCAAPGGKSTQIAAKLSGTGFLWSNEFVTQRTKGLISNTERLGVINAAVSSARPDVLCKVLKGAFDKVLVDAPCSGEGMFRKEPKALENWSLENSISCGDRQLHILDSAAETVGGGGLLCYSTCTFSYYENERVIEAFLGKHKDFSLIEPNIEFGVGGFKKYAPSVADIGYTRHIFPFSGGDGHFVALMRKEGDRERRFPELSNRCDNKAAESAFCSFAEETFGKLPEGKIMILGNKVYITPIIPDAAGSGIIRTGVLCGELKGNRFEPSHALFSAFGGSTVQREDLTLDDPRLNAFLRGEEIDCNSSFKGYTAVTVNEIPLSFGKASQGRLKNHYPKGLRLLK